MKEITFLDTIDKVYEILPWKCNDNTDLLTDDLGPQSGRESRGLDPDHDHGFGEIDETEPIDWTFDPSSSL